MSKTFAVWILSGCIVSLAPVGAVYAHHAAAAEYDVEKAVEFKGVLTKVEWVNPHVHMDFDIKGADGQTSTYTVEFISVGGLRRAGITNKKVLVIGETYTVVVNPARDGRHAGLSNTMTFPDGHVYRLIAQTPEGPSY